jgi:lipid A 3-O-deacylase
MLHRTLLLSLLLLALVAPGPVMAGEPFVRELRLGLLVHDMPGLWSYYRYEQGLAINGEAILAPALTMFGGHWRPAIGASVALGQDGRRGTSKAYLDARWTYEWSNGAFVGLGLGAAVHDGVLGPTDPYRKALGSRVLFHIPLELGIRVGDHHTVSVYFDHMSNAYTRSSNEGLDTLGVRYGYRF